MRRRLFTAVSVLSLVGCAFSAALWARSYAHFDYLGDDWNDGRYYSNVSVWSYRGTIHYYFEHRLGGGADVWNAIGLNWSSSSGAKADRDGRDQGSLIMGTEPRSALGIGFGRQHFHRPYGTGTAVTVPCFALCLAASMLPVHLALAHMRRLVRRSKKGCPQCGYNLTGNTSGVCPECGTSTAGS